MTVPSPHQVVAKAQETHDTWTLELAPNGATMAPGQFAMLYAFGAGEVPISVSRLHGEGGGPVHTIRSVGATTAALCALEPGATVGVRGPFGSAWPVEQARGGDVVVVAGGIGLAPLRPVIDHVLAHREDYGRLSVLYGGRAAAELLYLAELEQWRGRFDVDCDVSVDSGAGGWRGRVGVVTTLIPRADFVPGNAVAFVCGPEVMMRFAAAALRDAGIAPERIHLSMERSMKCGVGHCGHCQLREHFICKDGPVFSSDVIEPLMRIPEL